MSAIRSVARPRSVSTLMQSFIKLMGKIFSKLICLFDDLPFIFKWMGNIGTYLLIGAGFLIFPFVLYEGMQGLKKALTKEETPRRRGMIAASVAKIVLAAAGFGITIALLTVTALSFSFVSAMCSIGIPAVMSVISGVELAQKCHALHCVRRDTPHHQEAITKAKREVAFSAVFFGFSLAITALATLSVLSGLGIVLLAFPPAAVLIGVVATALVVKIGEIAYKKHLAKKKNVIGAAPGSLCQQTKRMTKTFGSGRHEPDMTSAEFEEESSSDDRPPTPDQSVDCQASQRPSM